VALLLRKSRKKYTRDIVCFHLQQCLGKVRYPGRTTTAAEAKSLFGVATRIRTEIRQALGL
jgi:hypothetical protein